MGLPVWQENNLYNEVMRHKLEAGCAIDTDIRYWHKKAIEKLLVYRFIILVYHKYVLIVPEQARASWKCMHVCGLIWGSGGESGSRGSAITF